MYGHAKLNIDSHEKTTLVKPLPPIEFAVELVALQEFTNNMGFVVH